ncbi:hypothetical protein G7K_3008-t1 [Saitoella complicata NRRL Y-17804]|uniref:Uncharacterized protein n=1 Tax=Saitoella complicata (strain BCRC 22490 / CBS 7301 / JCM 7358 / NBRC 10748 / NRRL Y-17804) TaxID=698492 RepID=A0A0E9NG39_SAICN|nr:hypothetical protein G7K_3008-t1 [Saitoella complicata NRRL Y-17804]
MDSPFFTCNRNNWPKCMQCACWKWGDGTAWKEAGDDWEEEGGLLRSKRYDRTVSVSRRNRKVRYYDNATCSWDDAVVWFPSISYENAYRIRNRDAWLRSKPIVLASRGQPQYGTQYIHAVNVAAAVYQASAREHVNVDCKYSD